MQHKFFPPVTDELIAALERHFPDRLPDREVAIDTFRLGMRYGHREVIDLLKAVQTKQENI